MSKIGLIDGDSFVYRAGFAVEKTKYLVSQADHSYETFDTHAEAVRKDGMFIWTRKEVGTLEQAVELLDNSLRTACDIAGAGVDRFVYLSPSGRTFRDAVATVRPYKGNRVDTPRPIYYAELRDHLIRNWSAHVARDEEADDKISWVARYHRENRRDYTIIAQDKDLKQVPGQHYDWVQRCWFDISEDEARIQLWVQALAGDSSDNVIGCWKVGDKEARNLVINAPGLADELMWPVVVQAYKNSQRLSGCPYKDAAAEDVALEMTRLVRLRQTAYEKLWIPPRAEPPPIKEEEVHVKEEVVFTGEEIGAEEVPQAV